MNDFSNLLISRILAPPPPLVIQFIQHKPMDHVPLLKFF